MLTYVDQDGERTEVYDIERYKGQAVPLGSALYVVSWEDGHELFVASSGPNVGLWCMTVGMENARVSAFVPCGVHHLHGNGVLASELAAM